MIIVMKRRGFTIVELLIVITIMGVLLVLSVASLRSSQASSRDVERKTDIESIVLALDDYYINGSDLSITVGKYPSTSLVSNNFTINDLKKTLRDIDIKSLTAPNVTNPTTTFKAAVNNTQTTAGVLPQPTVDQYIYQPIMNDGTLCTLESQECRKFNLYYRLEADNTVYMVTGKNR